MEYSHLQNGNEIRIGGWRKRNGRIYHSIQLMWLKRKTSRLIRQQTIKYITLIHRDRMHAVLVTITAMAKYYVCVVHAVFIEPSQTGKYRGEINKHLARPRSGEWVTFLSAYRAWNS